MECPNCHDSNTVSLPTGLQCRRCGRYANKDDGTEEHGNDIEYLDFFHNVTIASYRHSTPHPVDTIINLLHAKSFKKAYGDRLHYYLSRYLCDIFEASYGGRPESAAEILNWCNEHLTVGNPNAGPFLFLGNSIDRYLRGR